MLAVSEEYLVAARIRLGTLLDLVATFLDTLDMMFDLYPETAADPIAGAGALEAVASAAETTG